MVAYIIIEMNKKTLNKINASICRSNEEEDVGQSYENIITTEVEDKNIKPMVIMGNFYAMTKNKTETSETQTGDHGLKT